MFQAQPHATKQLQVIQGGKEHHRTLKGVRNMDKKIDMTEYRFTEYPSNSSVASGVTMLVAVWFLVAAGAVLADPASPYTTRSDLRAQTATVTVAQLTPAPRLVSAMAGEADTHFTITVETKRLKV